MTLERAARAHDLRNTADLAERLASELTALRAALTTFITARIGENVPDILICDDDPTARFLLKRVLGGS